METLRSFVPDELAGERHTGTFLSVNCTMTFFAYPSPHVLD